MRTYNPLTKSHLDVLESEILSDWRKLHEITDRVVWHYTDANGLHSILNYGTIRTSNALYLNDATEVSHATDLISSIAADALDSPVDPCLKEFLEGIQVSMQISTLVSQPLVGCFSVERAGDALHQWQSYGDSGKGYCLGFEPDKLPDPTANTILRRVIYEANEQKRIVIDVLNKYIWKFKLVMTGRSGITAEDKVLIGDFEHSISKIFHEFLYCFKHPSWESESEIRLVYNMVPFAAAKATPDVTDVKFRTSPGGTLIPYKDIEIWKEDPVDMKNRLPLKEIIVGPKIDFIKAKNSLKQQLENLGYDSGSGGPVSIQQSAVTLT